MKKKSIQLSSDTFILPASPFILAVLSLLGQLAQGDGEVARGSLKAVGAGIQLFDAVAGAKSHCRERGFNLRVESFGSRFGLLLGARERRLSCSLLTCTHKKSIDSVGAAVCPLSSFFVASLTNAAHLRSNRVRLN